jgi:hypothetical protein
LGRSLDERAGLGAFAQLPPQYLLRPCGLVQPLLVGWGEQGAARLRASQSASQSQLIRDSILDSNLGIRVRGLGSQPPQRVRQLPTAAAGSDATH